MFIRVVVYPNIYVVTFINKVSAKFNLSQLQANSSCRNTDDIHYEAFWKHLPVCTQARACTHTEREREREREKLTSRSARQSDTCL